MPLYIRDDEVHVLARRIAEYRSLSVTEAVRRALRKELAEIEDERDCRDRALQRLFEAFDAAPAGNEFGDAEMYDGDGLPR